MTSKLFTVIVCNRLDSRSEGFESLNNGGTNLIRRLAINLGHHCIAAFSLNQSNDCALMGSPNNRVGFPVPDVGASLNRFRPKSNGAPIWDLTASITATSIAFASLFLAAQEVPSIPTHRFVCVNLLLNRLVADRQLAGNLLRTPLQAEQRSHLN